MNTEIARVRSEAQGRDVKVNGWQEGTENVPGFVMVTDKVTGTTFAVKPRQPLVKALGKAKARMAAARRQSQSPTR